ncbi:hypothetical protein V8C35DRAFT_294239, partial [Trichoderma chlorosporum]
IISAAHSTIFLRNLPFFFNVTSAINLPLVAITPKHQTYTMDDRKEEPIYERDLDELHTSVVSNLSREITKPEVQWEQQLSSNKNIQIQRCKDKNLISFTSPLTPLVNSNRAKITLHHTGDIIPLSICPGCNIWDGKRTHQLEFGKRTHLSQRQHSLYIYADCTLYLLWLFKNREDFDGDLS